MRKKNKAGVIIILDFKIYYKAVVIIKRIWYWHKNCHTDQWNTMENPGIEPPVYVQLIFNKAGKNTQWKKGSLFNK